jgi:hypothetical protein
MRGGSGQAEAAPPSPRPRWVYLSKCLPTHQLAPSQAHHTVACSRQNRQDCLFRLQRTNNFPRSLGEELLGLDTVLKIAISPSSANKWEVLRASSLRLEARMLPDSRHQMSGIPCARGVVPVCKLLADLPSNPGTWNYNLNLPGQAPDSVCMGYLFQVPGSGPGSRYSAQLGQEPGSRGFHVRQQPLAGGLFPSPWAGNRLSALHLNRLLFHPILHNRF